jgi:hypothetical protein
MGMPADFAAERFGPAANTASTSSQVPTISSGTANAPFGPYPGGSWVTISVIGDTFHLRLGDGAQVATTSDAELPQGVHDVQMPYVASPRGAVITHSASIRVSVWRSSK